MSMFDTDHLEPDFRDDYEAWKANPSPESNAKFLTRLQPVIDTGLSVHVGEVNPLLQSRARQLTLKALNTYDRSRSRLQTHLFNQFQGLKRIAKEQSTPIHVPERVRQDRYHLETVTQELQDKLGRDPTDSEIANYTGFSPKRIQHVRGYNAPIAEGTLEQIDPSLPGSYGIGADSKAQEMWVQIVYDDLPAIDQQIMEYTLGLNGKPRLPNNELAKRLKLSPGAISQRKQRIQKILDQEIDVSPFLS